MSYVVTAIAPGGEFFVEVQGPSGPANVGLDDALSFSGVRETIEAIAGELSRAWATVAPDEATVEFGLTLRAKEGKLTGLLVSGGAETSLKIALKWSSKNQ